MLGFQGFGAALLTNPATPTLGTAQRVGAPARRLLVRGKERFRPLEQTAEHLDPIDQETGIGRVMAATLGDRAIHPQAVASGELVGLSQHEHPIIHPMQCLRTNIVFQIILRGVVRHGVIIGPYPALRGGTIPDRCFGLSIGPLLAAAQEGEAIADLQRGRGASSPRAFVMGSQIVCVKCKQLRIIEDPVQFLQDRVARLRRRPVDRTLGTLYNHGGPPGERIVLADTLLYPRWPPRFNSQSEFSDKN